MRRRSVVSHSVTPWTVALRLYLPMGFLQEKLPLGCDFLLQDILTPEIKPESPALAGGCFTWCHLGSLKGNCPHESEWDGVRNGGKAKLELKAFIIDVL